MSKKKTTTVETVPAPTAEAPKKELTAKEKKRIRDAKYRAAKRAKAKKQAAKKHEAKKPNVEKYVKDLENTLARAFTFTKDVVSALTGAHAILSYVDIFAKNDLCDKGVIREADKIILSVIKNAKEAV